MDTQIMDKPEDEENVLLTWNSINNNYDNGFASVDSQWRVTYLNRAAQKIVGLEVLPPGGSFWNIFEMLIPSRIKHQYFNGPINELPNIFVHYWEAVDNWYISRSYYSNNELSFHFKSSKVSPSVDARSNAMKALYKFITEISNECLWDWNLETKEFFWVDGGHKRLFGYKIENTWIPQSFWENRIHFHDKIKLLNKLSELAMPGGGDSNWDCEYRFQKLDGNYSYVHERGHVFFDSKGKACRILGATQDETSKYISEKKLEETRKKLSLIVEQTVNAVIITDNEGKINYINKAFSRSMGYEASEVYGKKPGELLQGPETDPHTVDYIRSMINDNLPFDCKILNYAKDGTQLWIHLQGQPLDDGINASRSYFSIQSDVTDQVNSNQKAALENKQNQIAITDAVFKALEKERNEIGKEIHDNLNHTLVASKLYLDLAKSSDVNRDTYLEKSSEYISHVIENIRRISKMLVTPELMGLISSIKTLIDDLKLAHPIRFSFLSGPFKEDEFSESLKLNIFRIIQEQLTNIIKHSKAKKSKIKIFKVAGHVVVTIMDNGVGCDLSANRKGVGLKNIHSRAALFDGTVDIKSKPGQGFQLVVTLSTKTGGF